jgi:Tfp pilus assembly protein PilF
VDIQRKLCALALAGAAGLAGCQSTGGLAFSNSQPKAGLANSSPDVSRQRYEGLAKEFPGSVPNDGKTPSALGAGQTADSGNIFSSTWSKTTAAVSSVFSRKPASVATDDPTSLASQPKKVGTEVYIAAGRLFENQGKLADAQGQYEKALQASPNDLTALVSLARLQDRQGFGPQAVDLYLRAAKAHPQNPLVHNDLGLCLGRQKQYEKSLESLSKAVELAPKEAKYHNNLATVLVEMGRYDEALSQFAATGNPAVAHYNLGYLLSQKGQTDLAARHFQQAIDLDSSLTPAREMLAQLGAPAPGVLAPPDTRVAIRPVSTPIDAPKPIETAAPAAGAGKSYSIGDGSAPAAIAPAQPSATPAAAATPGTVAPAAAAEPTESRSSYYEGVPEDAIEEILPLPPVEG